MTSPENRRTPAGEEPDSGGLLRKYLGWALFGAFGIGVAVGIALVAGQLASQPVGITGQPVSANSSLESPPDRTLPARPRQKDGSGDESGRSASGETAVAPGPAGSGSAGAVGSASRDSGGSGSGPGTPASPGSGGGQSGGGSSSGSPDSGFDDSDSDYDDDYDDDD